MAVNRKTGEERKSRTKYKGSVAVSLPKRLGFSALLLLGMLGSIELAGRLLPTPEVPIVLPSHPERGWSLPISSEFSFAGFPATSNSLGLRSAEPIADPELRMLVLGDSTVFGHGVDDEDPFAEVLAQRTGADVQNAGVPGYTCRQSAHRYREVVEALSPDIVLLYSMHNDARIIHADEDWLGAAGHHPLGGVRLLTAAMTWVRIQRRISRMSIQEFQRCLTRVIEAQHARGGRTLLITPISYAAFDPDLSVDELKDVGPFYGAIREVAEHTDTVHLDMSDVQWARGNLPDTLMLDDVHPTRLGHRLMARWIHAALLGSGLMEGPQPKDLPKPGTRNAPFYDSTKTRRVVPKPPRPD